MSDAKILAWLVENGCVDMAGLTWAGIAGVPGAVEVAHRILELEGDE